ncbi:MAG TPA: diguanylate cyclase [Pirellulales bacterium]|nr:diguanylate cyclase [Pirellulales bacterium]
MSTLLAVSTLELAIGALVGRFFRPRTPDALDDEAETVRLRETQQAKSELLDQMLDRVSELTGTIGKDVGAHNSRVLQIGHELQLASEAPEANLHTALMGAMSNVTEANQQLQQQLHEAEQKLIEQAYELQVQMAIARTDKLTGLLNRRACDDALAQRLGEFQRYGVPFTLLLVDIDRFKQFNDTHGHQAGDDVLRGVAKSLMQSMRDVDIVCRYGGEEFTILMPATELEGAGTAAERARQQIETAVIEHAGKQLHVTFSGGVAHVLPGECLPQLIKRADQALYAAKHSGRNCIHLHDGEHCVRLTAPSAPAADFNLAPQLPSAPEAQPTETQAAAPGFELPEEAVDFAHFEQQLRAAIEHHHETGTEVSMVVGSIDQLVGIDDREGDYAIDLAVRAAMQVIRAVLRDANTFARIAEDQIGLVLGSVSPARALTIMERARMAIEKCRLAIHGKPTLTFKMSFAIVEVLPDDNVETCLARGFDGLKMVVAAGGNQIRPATAEQPAALAAG